MYKDFCCWVYRDKKTNASELSGFNNKRELFGVFVKRKISNFGHSSRKKNLNLIKTIVQGEPVGRIGKGRLRTAYMYNIKQWTGHSAQRAFQARKCTLRLYWSVAAGVTRGRPARGEALAAPVSLRFLASFSIVFLRTPSLLATLHANIPAASMPIDWWRLSGCIRGLMKSKISKENSRNKNVDTRWT